MTQSETKSNVKGGKLQRQQRLLLNIGLMKDNRRVLGKQITTAVNEAMFFMKDKKHMMINIDGYEGRAEYIHRDKMVLDSKRLKEEQPKLYNSYLKPSESNEIKVDVDLIEERIKEQDASVQRVDAQVKKAN
jgi:hypothetical protein